MTENILAIYLNDHLAGATGGVELARRLADAHPTGDWAPRLRLLANDTAEDRAALITVMERLDVGVDQIKVALGWVAEKVGRLKFNGRLFSRSPLSDLIELEAMLMGVRAKAAGWRTLTAVAERDERLPVGELEGLLSRANGQIELLEGMRAEAARQIFGATVE